MLVVGLEELIATAEEGIDAGAESLVDRLVVLAGGSADLTPLLLQGLDLLDRLIEGRVRGERCRGEELFYLEAEALLSLEVLFL